MCPLRQVPLHLKHCIAFWAHEKHQRHLIFLQADLLRAELGLGIAFIALRIQLLCGGDMTHLAV